MFRDTSEELARLEAELLAAEESEADDMPEEEEYDEEYPEDWDLDEDLEEDLPEDEDDYPRYQSGYSVYNTDDTDEDLESYAEAVRTPKRSGCITVLVVLLCLMTVGILGLFVLILRQWGFL